jgi:hypothetical protein
MATKLRVLIGLSLIFDSFWLTFSMLLYLMT